MSREIRTHFYAGLLVILPIFLTIFILNWIITLIIRLTTESTIARLIHEFVESSPFADNEEAIYIIYAIYLIGILIFITLVGLITRNIVGKKIKKGIDGLIGRLPIIKHIYTSMRQFVNLISSKKSNNYKKVVLIEYPRKGIYSFGFLTSDSNSILTDIHGEEFCNIFIPTSPNPTSGMFVSLRKSEVTEVDMKIDQAVKLIVSGGVIMPGSEIGLDEEI